MLKIEDGAVAVAIMLNMGDEPAAEETQRAHIIRIDAIWSDTARFRQGVIVRQKPYYKGSLDFLLPLASAVACSTRGLLQTVAVPLAAAPHAARC